MSATTDAGDMALPARCRPLESPGAQAAQRDGTLLYCPRGKRGHAARAHASRPAGGTGREQPPAAVSLGRDASYYLHLPPDPVEVRGVLVAVHGISRNAREQVHAFGARAARLALATVAPVFSRERFPGYQRLGLSRHGVESFPHLALESILEEVADVTGADTTRTFLFGFSGGAQFAHRYAMRFPDRVRAIALGSAGWYTFPDVEQPFPRGLGATPLAQGIDPARFLRVPTLVLVGEHDHRRDPSLNTTRAIDLQQGRDRIERARRWTGAMRSLADRARVEARLDLSLLPSCGHDFGDCVRAGALVERVLDFVASATRPPRPADREPGGALVFSAGH